MLVTADDDHRALLAAMCWALGNVQFVHAALKQCLLLLGRLRFARWLQNLNLEKKMENRLELEVLLLECTAF